MTENKSSKKLNKKEIALKNANRALTALSRTNHALITATDEQKFLNETCEIICNLHGYLLAWIGFVDHDKTKSVKPVAEAGFEKGYLKKIKISWGKNKWGMGPTGTAIRTGKVQVVQHAMTNPFYKPWRKLGEKYGFNSSCTFPLKTDHIIGALMIYAADPEAFDKNEVKLLNQLAKDIAFGIKTIRMRKALHESNKRVQQLLIQTLNVAGFAVEKRDPYTAGHQRRTAKLAEEIAKEMDLPEEKIKGIAFGAMVHDIGKIYVPAEILSRPGKITDLEREIIKTHPQAGYDLVKNIDYPWPIAQIILQHHERLNGSGYPNGLKGNEILLEAKVVGVADVVEAMMTHRPYRPAHNLKAALKEINKYKGILYDRDVVNACLRVFNKRGFKFKKNLLSA